MTLDSFIAVVFVILGFGTMLVLMLDDVFNLFTRVDIGKKNYIKPPKHKKRKHK